MRFQVSFSGIMLLEESTARMRISVDRSRSTAAANNHTVHRSTTQNSSTPGEHCYDYLAHNFRT